MEKQTYHQGQHSAPTLTFTVMMGMILLVTDLLSVWNMVIGVQILNA